MRHAPRGREPSRRFGHVTLAVLNLGPRSRDHPPKLHIRRADPGGDGDDQAIPTSPPIHVMADQPPPPLNPAPRAPPAPANARWWIITWSCAERPAQPTLPDCADYLVGQQELGAGGFLHWQFVVRFRRCMRLRAVAGAFPGAHCEPTRSDAAVAYVQKDETRVPGTAFSLGTKPVQRGSKADWDAVFAAACAGEWDAVPRDIYIRNHTALHRIHAEGVPPPERRGVSCQVFVGVTGSGKTFKAYQEAKDLPGGLYFKCGRTKWWDGYKGESNVIIDEFVGGIDITYLLRWLDWYPSRVECKGGSKNLRALKFWITSNKALELWYPDASEEQIKALRRRVQVQEFNEAWVAPVEDEVVFVGEQTQEINELFGL